jgi:hypothetical protein
VEIKMPLKELTLPALKLPRKVENDPRHEALEKYLSRNLHPLWEKSTIKVPQIEFQPPLEDVLIRALNLKQLERGLEHIDQILDAEKKGLVALQQKQKAAPANRISRLLIIANDGTERFYRACESTLLRHSDRLLCLHVQAPSARIARNILGEDQLVKALLVSDREAVAQVLLALTDTPK